MRIECPTCRRVIEDAPDDHPPRPFCSARCKLADLDNWLNEAYRVSSPISGAGDGDGEGESLN
jgi:uncharacterized protein